MATGGAVWVAIGANGDLDENIFQQLATESGFGRLTLRMIKGSFPEVAESLSKGRGGLRLVKAA